MEMRVARCCCGFSSDEQQASGVHKSHAAKGSSAAFWWINVKIWRKSIHHFHMDYINVYKVRVCGFQNTFSHLSQSNLFLYEFYRLFVILNKFYFFFLNKFDSILGVCMCIRDSVHFIDRSSRPTTRQTFYNETMLYI